MAASYAAKIVFSLARERRRNRNRRNSVGRLRAVKAVRALLNA
jgi:hypothetical protein